MELPFYLKTLEPLPGALDILRYFGNIDSPTADVDEICDSLELSDRRFSKAIRRLVTKGYMAMDGDMVYRLTEQGQQAVSELAEFDVATGGGLAEVSEMQLSDETETVSRRMVLALPQPLVADKPTTVHIGFHPAHADQQIPDSAEIVVRLSVVNGEPETPEDTIFSLTNIPAYQALQITPGRYSQMRLKLHAFQLGVNPGDIDEVGGMYVDVPVTASDGNNQQLTAFGTDIEIEI